MTAVTDAIQYWERRLREAEEERDALITQVVEILAYVKLLKARS